MSEFTPATLPDLPYDFNALEPVIKAEIMEVHYKNHHKAYVTNYNAAMEKFIDAMEKQDIASMIALEKMIRFHGGGHVNHSIFWTNLASPHQGGGGKPKGNLLHQIEKDFGSFESFSEKMQARTLGVQGSGWGWLGFCKEQKKLMLATCANQDPLSCEGLIPLLGFDVWEHAYYLQYKSNRAEYLKNIWQVVNWKNIEDRFSACH